jgi:hypothetical protein
MDLVIDLLKKDLLELRNHIKFIKQLNIEILSTSRNYEYNKSSSKRKFDYSSIIISLYGIVENYIEKFCFEYIENIEKIIPTYDLLELKFRDNHLNLSIELIKKITENKHLKFANINRENIVNKLSQCISIKTDYSLNKEAFTINTGNLKHSKICETIGFLNIKLEEKLRKINDFNKHTENAFNKIDDLVQRRNEISHGNIQDILDTTAIEPYIDFTENYLFSIGQVLKQELITLDLQEKKKNSIEIINVKYFSPKIIGIVNGAELDFKKGDKILFEKSNNAINSCEVIEIKDFENKDVTLKLNKNIKKTYRFYKLFSSSF